jgi:hypothetical protein
VKVFGSRAEDKAMSWIHASGSGDGAFGVADWLRLAAAPTFAIMALVTGLLGGAAPDGLCSAMRASPLCGMALMYALMSLFHAPPWLKLIPSRASSRVAKFNG